jgi:hypothetical protein
MTDLTKLSKEELLARLEEQNAQIETLKSQKGKGMKEKVMELLEGGVNSIQGISEHLNITDKNVSSNLTYLRQDLELKGMTIVSHKFKNEGVTKLAIVNLGDMNW